MTAMLQQPLPANVAPSEPATPQDWERYLELRALERPTSGQVKERHALVERLGLSKKDEELYTTVLAEAERLETIIRDEDEVHAADLAAQRADAAARKAILDEICKLQVRLQNNDFPEAAACNAARQKCREVQDAHGQLNTIYCRWPMLFGLPLDTRRNTSENMPHTILMKLSQLGISTGS